MTRLMIVMLAVMLAVTSCGVRRVGTPSPEPEETAPAMPLDPLATAADREVVPEVYPVTQDDLPGAGDTLAAPQDLSYAAYDSANAEPPTEVYRVQIFTSRLYAEATRERALAEEIFNLPVYLDYEVPYYKLRVGDYVTRGEAENMLSEIRAIGYRNAWVARVMLRVMEVPEFDEAGEPILPADRPDSLYVPPEETPEPEEDAGEDR